MAIKKRSTKTQEANVDLRVLFGRRIRELRQDRGWTLAALGERAGLDGKFIQCVETATKSASLETIAKLASGLGVAPTELFTFVPEAKERFVQALRDLSPEDLRRIAEAAEILASR